MFEEFDEKAEQDEMMKTLCEYNFVEALVEGKHNCNPKLNKSNTN